MKSDQKIKQTGSFMKHILTWSSPPHHKAAKTRLIIRPACARAPKHIYITLAWYPWWWKRKIKEYSHRKTDGSEGVSHCCWETEHTAERLFRQTSRARAPLTDWSGTASAARNTCTYTRALFVFVCFKYIHYNYFLNKLIVILMNK